MKLITKSGDTLIEVLLSMAIIGLILAAAYATASRSLKTSQLTQERTNGLKLAEQQIELIKSLTNSDKGNLKDSLYSQTDNFCIKEEAPAPAGKDPVLKIVPVKDSNCLFDDLYEVSVSPLPQNVFSVSVTWLPPGGQETNKAELRVDYSYPQTGVSP